MITIKDANSRNRRGTAYVEYFIVATATVLATIWLWDGGKFRGLSAEYRNQLSTKLCEKLCEISNCGKNCDCDCGKCYCPPPPGEGEGECIGGRRCE